MDKGRTEGGQDKKRGGQREEQTKSRAGRTGEGNGRTRQGTDKGREDTRNGKRQAHGADAKSEHEKRMPGTSARGGRERRGIDAWGKMR